MKKVINYIVIIISALMVIFGVVIDLKPNIYMGGTDKIIIYVTPMLLLFCNMIFQIKKSDNEEEKEKIKKKMLLAIFIIYIIALATLLFLGSTYRNISWQKESISLFSSEHFENFSNLMPFRTIITYIERLVEHNINVSIVLINILGNLIAFAPMGFFIPMLFDNKIKNIKTFTAFVAIIVLIVELIQFITLTGKLDIDDIILNTLGAVIVYGLMKTRLANRVLDKLFK